MRVFRGCVLTSWAPRRRSGSGAPAGSRHSLLSSSFGATSFNFAVSTTDGLLDISLAAALPLGHQNQKSPKSSSHVEPGGGSPPAARGSARSCVGAAHSRPPRVRARHCGHAPPSGGDAPGKARGREPRAPF